VVSSYAAIFSLFLGERGLVGVAFNRGSECVFFFSFFFLLCFGWGRGVLNGGKG
jgi:hypothetical protein